MRLGALSVGLALIGACTVTREPRAPAEPQLTAAAHGAELPANPAATVEPARRGASDDAGVEGVHGANTSGNANSAAAAAVAVDAVAATLALPSTTTTSVGGPSTGQLLGGIPLPDAGPGFFHNQERPDGARFGTVELVQLIMRAAAIVDRDLPGNPLVVNDLSLREGGPIAQHGSHQNGRDADILYYTLDAHGVPIASVGVPLDLKGNGWDFKDLAVAQDDQRVKLDAPRTWRFMQALLEQAPEAVQRIFMVEHVRTLLIAQAEKAHAPKAIRERFADITCQPESPHDDHFHLRLFCTPEDMGGGCLDSPPIYPWRNELLKALGLKPLLALAYTQEERQAVRKRTTTPAAARKKAGRMDVRVRQFLGEREAWLKRPHPGRQYCR